MKLKDNGVVITGGSQGLGKTIAQACVREGAHVMICARDADLLERSRTELAAEASPGQRVICQQVDIRRRDDVSRLFDSAFRQLPSIDGLVNNAGVQGPLGRLEEVDIDEWWGTIEINLLGMVLACREVLPAFRRQGHGKIVNLSGGGATAPRPGVSAYAASKTAVVRMTETLAEETREAGIDVNAIAPGALNTRLLDDLIAAGPERLGSEAYQGVLKQKQQGGTPLSLGAELCVFLLSRESDGITGKLISAVWDPWRQLENYVDELRSTDIYTLRRVVPVDRGRRWD